MRYLSALIALAVATFFVGCFKTPTEPTEPVVEKYTVHRDASISPTNGPLHIFSADTVKTENIFIVRVVSDVPIAFNSSAPKQGEVVVTAGEGGIFTVNPRGGQYSYSGSASWELR